LALNAMTHNPIFNIQAWSLGEQYVKDADILINAHCFLPSFVLSALAEEILLKYFFFCEARC
jgi:hypothetical protein